MGGLGPFHWLIIGLIVLLLFGNRLPSVMRSLGRGMVEFKKGMEGIEDDLPGAGNRKIEDNAGGQNDTVRQEAKQGTSDKA